MTSEMTVRPANAIDKKILSLADSYSPAEISVMLGGAIKPETIAARVQTLLKSRNWLDEAQEDQLITSRMKDVLRDIEERGQDLDGMLARLKVLKELGARLDKRKASTEVDLNTYSHNVGRELGRVVDMALSYMKGALRDQVDPEQWEALKREAMLSARTELAKNEITE